jgi:hypothetical protein
MVRIRDIVVMERSIIRFSSDDSVKGFKEARRM